MPLCDTWKKNFTWASNRISDLYSCYLEMHCAKFTISSASGEEGEGEGGMVSKIPAHRHPCRRHNDRQYRPSGPPLNAKNIEI